MRLGQHKPSFVLELHLFLAHFWFFAYFNTLGFFPPPVSWKGFLGYTHVLKKRYGQGVKDVRKAQSTLYVKVPASDGPRQGKHAVQSTHTHTHTLELIAVFGFYGLRPHVNELKNQQSWPSIFYLC